METKMMEDMSFVETFSINLKHSLTLAFKVVILLDVNSPLNSECLTINMIAPMIMLLTAARMKAVINFTTYVLGKKLRKETSLLSLPYRTW